jgi:hypothetical protein
MLGRGDQVDKGSHEAPHQPRAQRLRRAHGDDDPETASTRRLACSRRPACVLGVDQSGEPVEVVAVETESGLLIIHAMRMRGKYPEYLERAADA